MIIRAEMGLMHERIASALEFRYQAAEYYSNTKGIPA